MFDGDSPNGHFLSQQQSPHLYQRRELASYCLILRPGTSLLREQRTKGLWRYYLSQLTYCHGPLPECEKKILL